MEALSARDPQRIGNYWLAGRLGSGGQGVVYDAYDADGNRVAVKVLHAADDRAVRGRFAKETTAARRVSSFCTARVLAADLDGRRPYLVSEYVPGPSLGAAVRDGRRFTGDDLHRLATAVATALTAIHDAGVVHRDLKPDNVLLGPDGPRVIDFGIARTSDMSLTRTGEVSGTPAYMAPEVFIGERAGAPADVFAWGAIMVFAATGREPFAADNLGAVMHRVLSHRPDLSALPPRLASLVEAAMAKDPAARPTARDLLLALVSGNDAGTERLLAAGSRTARGVHGSAPQGDPALGTIAEDAYESLNPEEREVAAEVFLRLVTVGEDGHEAGRSAGHDELFEGRPEGESAAVRRVLDAFSYVIVSNDGTVALSRPGLLRAWPRLRRWVEAERDGLAMLNSVNVAARDWAENGRRDADVLQGSRLEQALSWAATGRRHVTLTPFEQDFLRAGTHLTRRRARRRTLTTVALAGLLVVSLVAGGLAVWQRQETARQRDVLAARQAAAEADRQRTIDPSLAMLLSVAAWRISPAQPEARSSLTASLQQQETAVFRDPPVKGVARRLLSRDGRTLVSASEGGVNVYDVRTGRRTASWPRMTLSGTIIYPPALSRSGRLLAQTTTEKLGVWDLKTGRKLLERPLPARAGFSYSAVFGEHETTLTLLYSLHDVHYLLDVSTGEQFGRPVFRQRGGKAVRHPLVDRTGRRLLLPGDRLDQIALPGWRMERPFPACAERPKAVAFSRDGGTLACGGTDIVLVDAASGRALGDTISCDACGSDGQLRFSQDGRRLAAFRGRDVQVWDLRTRKTVLDHRAEGDLADVAFDPDGSTLRYVMDDAVVSMDLRPRTRATAVPGMAYLSGDGRLAAIATGKQLRIWDVGAGKESARLPVATDGGPLIADFFGTKLAVRDAGGTVMLWDLRTQAMLWSVPMPGKGGMPINMRFSPDGRRLATTVAYGQSTVFKEVVLDAADGRVLSSFDTTSRGGPFLPGGTAYVSPESGRFVDVGTGEPVGAGFLPTDALAISRGGLLAVYEGTTGRVGLWNADGPAALRPALPRAADEVDFLAFSPDGKTLATASLNGVLQLWDVEARRRLGGAYRLREGQPWSLAFSADGAAVHVGMERAVRAVSVDGERVAREVCARVGRPLSHAEWERYLGGAPYQNICP
ncbi:WD40 repeat domain-containing serine/threonine protein kinase [Nonomuraea sp. KM88]|uniref:WD40 repeat domain-containing serine/threonine protein kinase n=1 Tax=Nonomuraea sp. KM88 TaxID=3457427 RepID=UPI003FCD7BAA